MYYKDTLRFNMNSHQAEIRAINVSFPSLLLIFFKLIIRRNPEAI